MCSFYTNLQPYKRASEDLEYSTQAIYNFFYDTFMVLLHLFFFKLVSYTGLGASRCINNDRIFIFGWHNHLNVNRNLQGLEKVGEIGFGPSTIWHGRYKKIMYFSVFSLFFSPFDFNSFFEQFDHALVIKAQLYRQNIYVNHTEEQTVCRCLIRCTLGAVTFIFQ